MPNFTAQTSISSDAKELIAFLDAYAVKFGEVKHELFQALNRKEKVSDLEKRLQLEYRLGSQDVRSILTDAEATFKSAKELQKTHLSELDDAIAGIKKSIDKQKKKLKQLRKAKAPILDEIWLIRRTIHHKKRRLVAKQRKRDQLANQIKAGLVSVCFGSKKLFKAQHNLEANGYASHEEWLKDWHNSRATTILFEGSKRFNNGNLVCRLTETGELTITVPPCLQEQFGTHVKTSGIKFRHGQRYINHALTPKRYINVDKKTGFESGRIGTIAPITHRFVKRDGRWYLHTIVELPEIPYQSNHANGILGVDFNPTSIDWAYCDNQGNLKASGTLLINIQDRSTDQTKDALGKACAELVRLTESFRCPIAIEKLDFAQKKAALKEHSEKYARMLSNFAYSSFTTLLEARAFKYGIQLIKAKPAAFRLLCDSSRCRRVNPAYSSLQGLSKFMSMYGLNSGTAAALVLARRVLRFSERLPTALRNALKKPVDSFRHVWGAWSAVAKLNKGRLRHSFYTRKKGKLTALSRSPHFLFGEVGKEKSASILGCEPPA